MESMVSRKGKWLIIFLSVILLTLMGSFGVTVAAKEILIGVLEPMSGGSALTGANNSRGYKMAVDEINSAGGIKSMGGAKLKLMIQDLADKLLVHIVENKIQREQLHIIGVPCKGMIDRRKITAMLDGEILEVSENTEAISVKGDGFEESVKKVDVLQENCSICVHRNPVIYDDLLAEKVNEPSCNITGMDISGTPVHHFSRAAQAPMPLAFNLYPPVTKRLNRAVWTVSRVVALTWLVFPAGIQYESMLFTVTKSNSSKATLNL